MGAVGLDSLPRAQQQVASSGMKNRWKLLGLVALTVVLFVVVRLGSVTFALGLVGLIAALVSITYATKPRSGVAQVKKSPTRADAELQRWDVGGF